MYILDEESYAYSIDTRNIQLANTSCLYCIFVWLYTLTGLLYAHITTQTCTGIMSTQRIWPPESNWTCCFWEESRLIYYGYHYRQSQGTHTYIHTHTHKYTTTAATPHSYFMKSSKGVYMLSDIWWDVCSPVKQPGLLWTQKMWHYQQSWWAEVFSASEQQHKCNNFPYNNHSSW